MYYEEFKTEFWKKQGKYYLFPFIYLNFTKCNLKFSNNILETKHDRIHNANLAAQAMLSLNSGQILHLDEWRKIFVKMLLIKKRMNWKEEIIKIFGVKERTKKDFWISRKKLIMKKRTRVNQTNNFFVKEFLILNFFFCSIKRFILSHRTVYFANC